MWGHYARLTGWEAKGGTPHFDRLQDGKARGGASILTVTAVEPVPVDNSAKLLRRVRGLF